MPHTREDGAICSGRIFILSYFYSSTLLSVNIQLNVTRFTRLLCSGRAVFHMFECCDGFDRVGGYTSDE